jgi:hypothetical protein
LIDWIDAKCRTWGHAKRRINGIPDLDSKNPRHNGEVRTEAQDGCIPSGKVSSIMGRIKEEGLVGAAIHTGPAEPLEVMLGDALQVSVAIQLALTSGRMTERQYEALFSKYVIRGPTKVKLGRLGIGHKCFYDRINRAHIAMKPWLETEDNSSPPLSRVA